METASETRVQKIPKILHYVWMGGGKKNELIERCVASWHKFCPDYEIIEWNEQNFDVNSNPLIVKALEQKNWAFAADIIRLKVIHEYGGIYVDTDAEILKPLDDLLYDELFIGYENTLWLNPATFGAVKGHPFLARCLERYEEDGKITFSTNPLTVHTYAYVFKTMYGLKLTGKTVRVSDDIAVYSEDWFCPQNYMTSKLTLTENSHVIHRYTGTWFTPSQKFWAKFARFWSKIFGRRVFRQFERIVRNQYFSQLKREYKKIDKRKLQQTKAD